MWIEISLLLLIIWLIWENVKKPPGLPPGPWGFPIIGCLPIDISQIQTLIEQMKKKYGPIFSMRIGSRFLVFLCEYNIIKEALQNDAFANRPNVVAFMSFSEDAHEYGVAGTNGLHWKKIRTFMLRHLRDLGMGKSKMVSAIHFEALKLVEIFKKQAGTAAVIPKAVTPAAFNVLWQMVATKRYDFDDKDLIDIQNKIKDFEHSISGIIFVDIFPWLRYITPKFILDKISNKTKYIEISNKFEAWFKKEIDDHMETLDTDNPRDFIDKYLIEMEKLKDDLERVMSYKDLIGCLSDLFAAAIETASTALNWAVLFLAKFPLVQNKLHEEIDSILPEGTPVTLEAKPKLPYLEAFIAEALRYSSMASFSGIHSVLTNTKINEYTIPKDSIVMPMIQSINFNCNYFDSPKEFKPERFLNSEGIFKTPKNGFIPFGIGKRKCLGESFARMELFVFLATFLQHLKFSSPENEEIDIRPHDIPLFNQPKPTQKILVTVRK